jgi:hypothetical protein
MNYSGRVLKEGFSGDFLKECLSLVSENLPFRGPTIHRHSSYIYHCDVTGDVTWFQGKEGIYYGEEKIYECYFHGGMIA